MNNNWRELFASWISLYYRQGLLIDKLEGYREHFPGQDDLEGAMAAIKRLQDVYNLKAQDFTRGKYGLATESGSMITAMDAFKIGRGAFLSEDMENTRQWMGESLQILDLEPNNSKEKPSRFSVLDHLAWSSYKVTLSTSTPCFKWCNKNKRGGGGPRAPKNPPHPFPPSNAPCSHISAC